MTASSTALSSALIGTMDTLLAQRQDRLAGERNRPVLLTLGILAITVYLLGALWRATSQDVRTVLEDISTVTTGALNQTVPLTGSDEFAQMSSAMVYARDRLTALLGELRYQATHDELTALGNRAQFIEKLTDALADGQPPLAVVLVDLDGFKDVNDSFGHEIGDRLLRTVGARLHRAAGRGDVVCRLAGDEFAVLLQDVGTQADGPAADRRAHDERDPQRRHPRPRTCTSPRAPGSRSPPRGRRPSSSSCATSTSRSTRPRPRARAR